MSHRGFQPPEVQCPKLGEPIQNRQTDRKERKKERERLKESEYCLQQVDGFKKPPYF